MKAQIEIIFFFLISSTFAKIVIQSASPSQCHPANATTQFSIKGYSTEELYGIYPFNFSIYGEKEGEKYNYNVNCLIPTNKTKPPDDGNSTPTDSVSDNPFDSTFPTNEESETDIPSHYTLIRLLENNYQFKGSCSIENITKNIAHQDIYFDKSEDINIDTSIKLNFSECYKDEHYESKLIISFRQLNGFVYKDNKITFLFYGMISKDLPSEYQIEIEVKLIQNGKKQEETKIAKCFLNNEVIIHNNIPVQGDFSCTIGNVYEKNINSFEYYSSTYITGVPEDKILLNPEATEKYIIIGEIVDYSVEKNKKKTIPSFVSESINNANCKEKGKFTIAGKLNTDLNDDLNFEFPLANPRNLVVTCSIKSGKANEKKEINCETNGKIDNEKIMIAQTTILNKNKEEVLIINKYEDKKESNCKNGIVNTITTKIDIPIPITFRQVNQFISLKNKASFHFIGIANQFVPFGRKIKMLVFIIIKGKKEQKEANCILNTYTPFNSPTQSYGQADFYCETDTSNKIDDLEIISSDEILGLNELDDYQKSPNSTDIKIKETETETNLGKVINYSSNQILYDIPPVFNIFNIYINENCQNRGKIRVEADFEKRIDKQFDFIIPLSYPDSSIKCTAPKIEANKKVILDCKVQKDFTINNDNIIIEPRIIKKKHQEVIYVKKYNKNISRKLVCKDYNALQKKIEEESEYTFLQTNNFKPLGGGKFSFKIFICPISSLINFLLETIKITIIVKKKPSNLRNLDEPTEGEENISCNLQNNNTDQTIGEYSCSSYNLNINNENEIESFEIESKNLSGINEGNNNPIETDIKINKGEEFDISTIDISTLPYFNDTYIYTGYGDTDKRKSLLENCKNNGIFYINGLLTNETIADKIKNFEIRFSNPPDSSAICNFTLNDSINMECQNKEYFEKEIIQINDQVVGGTFFFTQTKNMDGFSFTCDIGSCTDSLELKLAPIDVEGNTTEQSSSVINSYFSKKISSSGGLSGGTIAAIVICSAVILIAVGILITLIKKGVLIPPKSAYPTSYGSTVPEISNSSVDII